MFLRFFRLGILALEIGESRPAIRGKQHSQGLVAENMRLTSGCRLIGSHKLLSSS